jgi:hypothetical protein
LAIGITMAVRAPASIGALAAAVRASRYRSRPDSSTKKPVSAVQNPADTHAKSGTKSARVAISSGRVPW